MAFWCECVPFHGKCSALLFLPFSSMSWSAPVRSGPPKAEQQTLPYFHRSALLFCMSLHFVTILLIVRWWKWGGPFTNPELRSKISNGGGKSEAGEPTWEPRWYSLPVAAGTWEREVPSVTDGGALGLTARRRVSPHEGAGLLRGRLVLRPPAGGESGKSFGAWRREALGWEEGWWRWWGSWERWRC